MTVTINVHLLRVKSQKLTYKLSDTSLASWIQHHTAFAGVSNPTNILPCPKYSHDLEEREIANLVVFYRERSGSAGNRNLLIAYFSG